MSVAVQRMCTAVARWTREDDEKLIRAMAYLKTHSDLKVHAALAPSDLDGLTLDVYTDADWHDKRSQTGFVFGLEGRESKSFLPLQ